jgi:hypothetical protein
MKSKYISLAAASALSAVALFGGMVSLSSAASGGPSVTLTSTEASSTSSASIPVVATFSSAVNSFTNANVTATNATVGTVSGSGTTFTFTLTPTAAGTVTVMLAADAASSTASSTGSQVSNTLVFTYTPQTAFLALSNYSGPPGTSINALGTNFGASESVAVAFGGATTTATTNASGDFTLPLVVPSLPVGSANITATGATSNRMATNSFFVQEGTTSTTTPSTSTSTPALALVGIDTIQGNATADGTFANGWEWVLHLTMPDSESHFAMKFGGFTSSSSSSTIPALGNIRIYSPQSQTASTTGSTFTMSGTGYSQDMMLSGDTSASTAGRQIDVHVQVAVPAGTANGNYTTTFGALSTTTPF